MKNLEIIYRNDIPYGIRYDSGYILFFREIHRHPDQHARYELEIHNLQTVANTILKALKDSPIINA